MIDDTEDDVDDLPPNIEELLQSKTVLTPEWVKTGKDYVKWVRSINKSRSDPA